MNKFLFLLKKYKTFILYAIFGVLTTVINVLTYAYFYKIMRTSNLTAVVLAWVIAVLFAFITNKIWVFDSKSFELKILIYELFSFFLCRFSTGLLDAGIMYVSVDKMHLNEIIWKTIANIIVIILNYIASKVIIFIKKDSKKK